MQLINRVPCSVTGNLGSATICPELRSEIHLPETGNLICDGISDADLLMMHEFGHDADGRMMPLALLMDDDGNPLEGVESLPEQASNQSVRAWAMGLRQQTLESHRQELLVQHEARIRSREQDWDRIPETEADLQELLDHDMPLIRGLAKVLAKLH